jgi:hypothetical protein
MNYVIAKAVDCPNDPLGLAVGFLLVGIGIAFAIGDMTREAKEGKTGRTGGWFVYFGCVVFVVIGLAAILLNTQPTIMTRPASVAPSSAVQPQR